jgi:hypothetical protein
MVRVLFYLLVTPASNITDLFGMPGPAVMLLTLAWAGFTVFIPSFLAKFVNAGGSGGRGGQVTIQAVNSGINALRALK